MNLKDIIGIKVQESALNSLNRYESSSVDTKVNTVRKWFSYRTRDLYVIIYEAREENGDVIRYTFYS